MARVLSEGWHTGHSIFLSSLRLFKSWNAIVIVVVPIFLKQLLYVILAWMLEINIFVSFIFNSILLKSILKILIYTGKICLCCTLYKYQCLSVVIRLQQVWHGSQICIHDLTLITTLLKNATCLVPETHLNGSIFQSMTVMLRLSD